MLSALLIAAGCDDEPFEPIQQSDMEFSIYGYLNASADTQWVRVTSIKTTVLPDSEPPDVAVALEHLGTGEITPLRDTLVAYGTSLYARNFSTDVPMERGATYRITADRADGGSASAMAKIPVNADSVVVRIPQGGRRAGERALLRTAGTEYTAMVHVFPGCGFFASHQFGGPTVRADENGVIERPIERPLYCMGDTLRAWDARIVFSGSPWPYDPEWSRITAFLPEVGSNIEGGIGFFGGVLIRTEPFETCYIIGADPEDYCDLVYTDRPTVVEGVVRERVETQVGCEPVPLWKRAVFVWEDDHPADIRTVRVEEIHDETVLLHEPDGVVVRSAYTGRDGSFKISALEPGLPYSLAVSYKDEPDHFEPEPFVVEAGQTLVVDVELPGECA